MGSGGDMDYAPPTRSDHPAMASRLVVQTPVADTEKMFFLRRENRFFLPMRGDLPHGIFDPATAAAAAPGREHDPGPRQWNASNGVQSAEASGSEDEEEEYDDDAEEGDGEIDGLVSTDNGSLKYPHNSSGSAQSSSEKMYRTKVISQEDQSSFGSSGGGLEKDGINCEGSMGDQQRQQVRASPYGNALAIMAPETQYVQILQGGDVAPLAQKDARRENECGGQSRRRDGPVLVDLGESLRKHLSDPISGTLMDDAMILACGHSFGTAGMEQVMRLKVCCSCGKPVLEDSIRPNLALRSAVQAFLREDELQSLKAPKRRRERLEQDKCNNDSFHFDISKAKGVQFPFNVSDRVMIKGNKRTPQRFVGRIAVVTTQCLNGWYVVKTLDNAESVKLQYRSLEKAPEELPSDLVLSKAAYNPNWL